MWHNGLKHGQGKEFLTSGKKLTGNWVDGMKHGIFESNYKPF